MKRFAMTILVMSVCLLTIALRPAHAYWDDVHYYLTYYVARLTGFTPLQAYRIAAANLSTDYDKNTEPTQPDQSEALFGFADPPPVERQNPRWKFHAFRNQVKFRDPVGNGTQAQQGIAMVAKQRDELYQAGVRANNPGMFLHSFQDEVPHAGFGSAWGHNFNPDKPAESTEAARRAGLHIGGSVDWLSFHDKIVSVNLVYDTAAWLSRFMREVEVKEKRRQRQRVFEFAASEAMLDALRDQNVAPQPLAVNELPTYIQFYKASLGLGAAPTLTADQRAKFIKHKDGPDLGKAEALVVAAMKQMGMIEGSIPPLAQARKEFTFDSNGNVTSSLDKWVLYGALEVTLEDNSRQPKPVEVVVKAPATMRGETEYDLTEPVEMRGGDVKRWEDMPIGEVVIELRRDGKRLTEKRVTIDELVEKDTISPTVNKSVLFLIDTSGSMAGTRLENAKLAAESAVRARATEGEEWALLSFDGHKVFVQRDFGTDVEAFAVSVRNLRAGGDTPLVWAVTQALIYLYTNGNAPVGQVVILSDGGENCKERSPGGSKAAVDGLNRVLSNLRLGAAPSSQRVAAVKKPLLLAMAGDDARLLAYLQTSRTSGGDAASGMAGTPRHLIFGIGSYLQTPNSVPRELGQPNQTVDDALRELHQVAGQTRRRTSVSIVGFNIQGSADEQQLRSIAQSGGGGYFTANDTNALQNALGQAASGARGDSGGLDISGVWQNDIANFGTTVWTFTRLDGNRYSATEQGLGNARGTAVVTGNHLRLDFSTGNVTGYYEWFLDANGRTGQGRLVFTSGASGTHTTQLTRKSPPESGSGSMAGSKGGWLGIWAQTTTAQQVQVLWVEQNSPADGRLQPGDILLAVDQTPLTSVQQLTSLLTGKKPGDTLTFRVRQNNQEKTVTVSLGNTPPASQRTLIVSGAFQGPSFAGYFTGYLDPNRRFSYGVMTGRGVELDGTFDGTWDPNSGAVDLSFKGKVKVVFNFSLKGVIRGRIDPTGQGSGTFEGTGAAGVERGTWTCVPLVSPQVAAM